MAYQDYTYTNEPFTANLANTYIRDNLNAIRDPGFDIANLDESANFTTSGTTFGNVDSLNDAEGVLRHTITVEANRRVMVGFNGMIFNNTNASVVYFNISIDGTDAVADDGLIGFGCNGVLRVGASFIYISNELSAGSHIFRLRWKTTTATTATLYAGAGTASYDVHPQFWVRQL